MLVPVLHDLKKIPYTRIIIIFRSGSGGDGSSIVNERETWIIFKKLYET